MKITIAERMKPFSHVPGAACLIPGTVCKVEAFPTLIRIAGDTELVLQLTGPVRGFTLEQDLEKNRVSVFGKAREGFYRLHIEARKEGIGVTADKVPHTGLVINGVPWRSKERQIILSQSVQLPAKEERLSLGMSRAQDWDLVWRRGDVKEILPILFILAQKIPASRAEIPWASQLLEAGEWESFCLAAFSHMLVPRLHDPQHQGLIANHLLSDDPSVLFPLAFWHLRRLFFRQNGACLELLPASPFDAGRLVSLQISEIGTMDLEWASRCMRRACLRASHTGNIAIQLQEGLHSFRMRSNLSSKGHRYLSEEILPIEAGQVYFFDRFQI
ncbi:MAG: hypothetical protein HY861_00570 [Chlamydiia bacterium]|nr:hypothetical protein [Chlamydiia bacterium]